MIQINDIINLLEKEKINNKFTFHKYSIDKLKRKDKKELHKIHFKEYILYGVRKYLLNNIDSFTFVLSKYKYKNTSYLKYKLNKLEKDNFLTLIKLMEEFKSNILKLNKVDISELKNIFDTDTIYFNIIYKQNQPNQPNQPNQKLIKLEKYIEIKNYYDTISFLLNIESIKILKYQRLDRIKEFLLKPEGLKVFEILQNYNQLIHSMTFEERDLYIIHSGTILGAIGTTYTRDVDVIVVKPDIEPNIAKEMIKNINNRDEDIDLNIIDKYGDYYTNINEEPLKYKKQWLTYQLPQSDGASDIYEVLLNSKYHFFFIGIKLFNLNLTINRFLQRASVSSMADLLMLKEFNNIDISNKICLPNLTIRQGKIKVFYGDYLEHYFNSLQKALKEYYNKDFTIDELKTKIKHCNEMGFDIYKGEMVKDPDTNIIKYFHIKIKEEIIRNYAKNSKYLLDVGTGKLTDMRIWDDNNIKNVVGIEPSIESLKLGEERIKKFGFKGKLDLVNGTGDDDWSLNNKYKIVLDNKYDVITFQFTLHYMMNNIKTVISNLKKVMLPKCKIIITCMDGNKIQNDINKYGHVEIRNKQEPIFAIFPMYKSETIPEKDNNILVYFKGAYGVSSGSFEPIVDIEKLITIFKDNNINLINRKNFADYNINIKNKLFPNQLKVSSYYLSLIFEYEKN
jgi:ubiquinone/menaquinone biosynthesis C-methylase UbiE